VSTALSVQHDLQAPALEVIPSPLIDRMESTLAIASGLTTVDATNVEAANAAVMGLHRLEKDIVAHVETIKKPLNGLLKAVRECAERAEGPVARAKARLQTQIATHNAIVKRRADEEAARVEADKRKAQAEADAENRRREQEARAKAEAEAKEAEALIGSPVQVVVPEVEKVKPAEVAPAAVTVPTTPSAVVTKLVPTLEIYDPKVLAAAYSVAGEVLVEVRTGVVRKLLDAGVAVPGARLVMKEQTAMRGTR
jgi:hypothetical protein